jgi:hypothetical protein
MVDRHTEVLLDNLRFAEAFERVEHRHTEGWHPMQPVEEVHDAASVDKERDWRRGAIFRCAECDDVIRVIPRRRE